MQLPDQFDSDAKYLDRNKRFGKDFPRYVSTSAWSLKNNLQNRDVRSITVEELCYAGLHNISLRYLANGYPTSVVLTRGVKESILGEKLMKEVRNLGVDIDTLSKMVVEREYGQSLDNSSLEQKTEAIAKLASIMVNKVVKDFPEISMNLKRVRELKEGGDDESQISKKRSIDGEAESSDAKVFKTNAPAGHTPKAVNKWLEGLQLSKIQKRQLEADTERFSKLDSADLQAKLLEKGLPMKIVQALKSAQLGTLIAASVVIASNKD